MNPFCFSFLSFLLMAFSLSAAKYEVDLQEYFPKQLIFKSMVIEGDFLCTETDLDREDGYEIFLAGPKVQFRLVTLDDGEWGITLNSVELHLLRQASASGWKNLLDLRGNSSLGKLDFQNGAKGFVSTLLKTFIGSKGAFHFRVDSQSEEASADSSFAISFAKGKQRLSLTSDSSSDLSSAAWQIESSLLGKGTLIDLLITAIKEINNAAQQATVKAENRIEETVQQLCLQLGAFFDFAAPLLEWEGANVMISGDAKSQDEADSFLLLMNNDFKLSIYQNTWSAELGTRSYYLSKANAPCEWKQEFIIKNPSNDLDKLCQWIQVNATEKLANYLEAPSIAYYGNYFPSYFSSALKMLFVKLGEPQADGTLLLTLSGEGSLSTSVGYYNVSEVAQLLVNSVKEKVGGYFW
jgi:hypothetical protein